MSNFISRFFSPTHLKRFFFFFLTDFLVIILSLYLSFQMRFDFFLTAEAGRLLYEALPFFLLIKLSVFLAFRLCNVTWQYVGLKDLLNVAVAVLVSEAVLVLLILLPVPPLPYPALYPLSKLDMHGFPRSIFLIDGANSFILVMFIRVSKRIYLEVFYRNGHSKNGLRTLLIGAGNAGEMILRDIAKQGRASFYPVGILDDDQSKIGAYIHGVKVVGKTGELKDMVLRCRAESAIIAIPSLGQKKLKDIYNSAAEAGLRTVKIVPRIYDFGKPEINLKSLESIKIEDLIGRQAVEVDYAGIRRFIRNKVVLVTGAGGSIGSEIVHQVCSCSPDHVILFDIDETELHNMELRLKRACPRLFADRPEVSGRGARLDGAAGTTVSFSVGDVRDRARLEEVFAAFRPQIVFHAAAYKHVPMMEHNPHEAVKVNMFGTRNAAEAACRNGVEKFIMVSTDKAVRPTSVMGATKRMAEYVCKAFNGCGATEFVSVRFGNVLGSRGSVLPLFLDQLKGGGPLTVTHAEMKRYFMTIPEAVSLVMQASLIGKGGEILVLDMGEPVKIVELAEELIRLNGMEPYKDIDIVFDGLRPGEKLFEEILTAEEGTCASLHEKIFIAKNGGEFSKEEIDAIFSEFDEALKPGHAAGIRGLLKKYVPHSVESTAQPLFRRGEPSKPTHEPVDDRICPPPAANAANPDDDHEAGMGWTLPAEAQGRAFSSKPDEAASLVFGGKGFTAALKKE